MFKKAFYDGPVTSSDGPTISYHVSKAYSNGHTNYIHPGPFISFV